VGDFVCSEVMERVEMFAGVLAVSSSASVLDDDAGGGEAFLVLDFGVALEALVGFAVDFDVGCIDSEVACSVGGSAFVEERVTRFEGSGTDADSVVLRFLCGMLVMLTPIRS
jgi:hypothetical protein